MMLSKIIFPLSIFLCASTMLNGMNTLLNKASTIQSKVGIVVLANLSEATVLSIVDKTLITISSKCDYINSTLQTISATTSSIESFIDLADNAGVTTVSKLNIAASAYTVPQSVIGNILSLDQTIGSKLATISSELDVSTATVRTISSKLDYILPIVSGIDTALINTSILNVLWSTIDVALHTINSTIQNVDATAHQVSSFINDISTQIGANIPIASTASSLIDISNSVMPTILTRDIATQSRLSNIVNILSRIDTEVVSIQSSLNAANTAATLDTVDFFGTWTALNQLNGTLLTIASTANTLSSSIASLDFAYSNAGTFTVIDAINQSLFTSQSKVVALSAALSTQASYQGTFTVLNAILAQEQTSQSLLDSTAVIQHTLLGRPIYQSDVGPTGYTISSSGSYYLAENINFSPSVIRESAITISVSNVRLNLNGKVIRATPMILSNGIRISASNSANNIIIENGFIMDCGENSILTDAVSHLIVQDLIFNQRLRLNATYFVLRRLTGNTIESISLRAAILFDSAKHGIIEDCVLCSNSSDSTVVFSSANRNTWIKNCSFCNRGLASGCSVGGMTNCYVENCVFSNNNSTGFATTTGTNRLVCKKCSMTGNGGNGMIMSGLTGGVMIDNTFTESGGIGVRITSTSNVFLRNNFERNLGQNVQELSGLNCYLGNVAFNSTSDQLNYNLAVSAITNAKSIVRQSGALPTPLPTYWYNLSVLP